MIELEQEDPIPQGDLALQITALPRETNGFGDIFGGWLVAQMDLAGTAMASKVAGLRVNMYDSKVDPAVQINMRGSRSLSRTAGIDGRGGGEPAIARRRHRLRPVPVNLQRHRIAIGGPEAEAGAVRRACRSPVAHAGSDSRSAAAIVQATSAAPCAPSW